jgi:hypothetical protein
MHLYNVTEIGFPGAAQVWGTEHAFFYDGNDIYDINGPEIGRSIAYGINNYDQVVGKALVAMVLSMASRGVR